ncbi:MAG: helix-turn-helix domain-containing protein [Cyanobacteria bacterium J06634_6]
MPSPLRAILDPTSTATLSDLRIADSVPYRVRDRAHMMLMSAKGWNAPALAKAFNCHEHTVCTTIKQWNAFGLYGLWDKDGRGRKRKWQPADLAYLIECLNPEERTYNSEQLAVKLWEERQVKLSADRIRRLLKKRTIAGNAPDKATGIGRTSPLKPWPNRS